MEEYFQSCLGSRGPLSLTTSTSSAVTVEPINLVFDEKMSSSVCASWTSSRAVSVTNHTKLELGYTTCYAQRLIFIYFVLACYCDTWCSFSLVWTAASDSPFSVFPPSCKLNPLKSTSFIVTYDPKLPNTVHAAQLECFAYHQVLPSYVNRVFRKLE